MEAQLHSREHRQLIENITRLTSQIEENYPELYRFLGENAQLFKYSEEHEPLEAELENHLSTLKQYLAHHLETHRASKTQGT